MDCLNELRVIFSDPGSIYRSAPFWSWNDKLSTTELKQQIEDMKAQGMGGFFMHSREGLETEYMSAEWMECVQASVETADKQGMSAWIYDEDRWPSGAAGGLVPACGGDDFRSKGLTITLQEAYGYEDSILALFAAKVTEGRLISCRQLDVVESDKLNTNEIYLVFRREVSLPSEWFNDDAPSDNLNPLCVKAFIDTTYEAYKKKFGNAFGKAIPGIFTDEPNVAHRYCKYTGNRGFIPWTDGFIEYFLEKRGYDLMQDIPYVFLDGQKSTKVRHDYWHTVTERFCEAYSKQLGNWCERNNLNFTGHFLFENEMGWGIRTSGAIMPHYIYQHIPGIDMLDEQTHEHLTVKQCTSVANQFGRTRVLSEMYACTGWEFDFEGQKWMGDWQYVLGINLRCQHLALYSLKGCRKRDFPPAFSYNTSWWKYNHVVEDYFARLSAIGSSGHVIRDMLVIHPIASAWSMMGSAIENKGLWSADRYIDEVDQFGEEFNDFVRYLLGLHIDFDLGDESIIDTYGEVRQDKFIINQAAYSVVVLPAMITLFSGTQQKLVSFMDAGGIVIAMEPAAKLLDGIEDARIEDMYAHTNLHLVKDKVDLSKVLEKISDRKVSIKDKNGYESQDILCMLREYEDCTTLFAVNNNRYASVDVRISLKEEGGIEEWNLLTGQMRNISFTKRDDCLAFPAHFGPAGSRLYVIDKKAICEKTECTTESSEILTCLGPVCPFTRMSDNVLVLDKCCYKIMEGNWSEETDVWKAQQAVRQTLDMRQVYYNGLPQRYKWVGKPHPKDGTQVSFRFEFYMEHVPEQTVYLVVEDSWRYCISCNEQVVEESSAGWFLDKSFDKIPLSDLHLGQNEIVLSCAYTNAMEMEDCYLVGDFGVSPGRSITVEPELLHFGDWCFQGYFHYCGSITYHLNFDYTEKNYDQILLILGEYRAVTSEVRVNGKTAGYIPWKAAEPVDILPYLHTGKNQVDIEVMGSPRNMLGPLHHTNDHIVRTNWSSFRSEDTQYTPSYVVKPYGLFGQIKVQGVRGGMIWKNV